MVEQRNISPPVIDENIHYVLDGGALIHRLPWEVDQTYNDIVHMYTSYVTTKYITCVVVFYGYSDRPSTKDAAHARRADLCNPCIVKFQFHLKLEVNKMTP